MKASTSLQPVHQQSNSVEQRALINRSAFEFHTDDPGVVKNIAAYRWSPWKTILFTLLSLFTAGIYPILLWLWRRGPSEWIRQTHSPCKVGTATCFLVKTIYKAQPVICYPRLISQTPGRVSPTMLKPLNRIRLAFCRKIVATLSADRFVEFVAEGDSASSFKVHTDNSDLLRAGIDLGPTTGGIFVWSAERRIFQRYGPMSPISKQQAKQQAPPDSATDTADFFEADDPDEAIINCAMDSDFWAQELRVNDDKIQIELYRQNRRKTWLCRLLSLASGGLLSAIFVWKPTWWLSMQFDRLSFGDTRRATHVKITDCHIRDNVWIRQLWLQSRKGVLLDEKSCPQRSIPWTQVWRFFIFESMPFVLDMKTNRFAAGPSMYDELAAQSSPTNHAGTVPSELRSPWARRALCGFNVTPVPLTPIWLIFWREAFSPLYIFQVACCIMWFLVDYTIYASCLLIFAFFTISWSVYMTFTNEHAVWKAVVGNNPDNPRNQTTSIRPSKTRDNISASNSHQNMRGSSSQASLGVKLNKSKPMYASQLLDDAEKDRVMIAEHGDMECGFVNQINPKFLVPGDVVFLGKAPDGRLPQIPADLVLLEGSCLVDESMLSGEVTPVTKFSCPNPRRDRPLERNMLHSGTRILSISSGAATAMVTTIGFCTTRGRLVRSVLRPSKADVRFTVETIKFLGVMAIVGISGLIYTVIIRVMRNEDPVMIMIMCGVLAAVVVPPQLSVGLTISLVVAQVRLKARKIFCTNPKSITPTGSVDLVCFDKTGTLTEESVRLKNVLTIGYRTPPDFQDIDAELVEKIPFFQEEVTQTFELCAASCNTLTTLNPASTNVGSPIKGAPPAAPSEPIGDPIDLELFRFSQFKLLPSGLFYSLKRPTLRVEILKNFGFSPERRSACVVVKVCDYLASNEESIYVFVKGAPEHILPNCLPQTIPKDCQQLMADSTHGGLRLILLAIKRVKDQAQIERILDQSTHQDVVEEHLELCGISFFENCVKPESRGTISQLKAANLRSLIITGDDVRTAVATARDVGICQGDDVIIIQESHQLKPAIQVSSQVDTTGIISVNSFIKMSTMIAQNSYLMQKFMNLKTTLAITEDSWQILRRESLANVAALNALNVLLERGAVFARFRPEQKAEVVTEYRNRFGFIVAMIGDGANDCCALKAADVGIALTEAEASVASAFTCKNRNVSPVIDILKEGRCSLISTFGLFGVMVSYSCVQFSSMCILYWIQSNFADFQFLYLDLFLLTTLSLVFPLVPAFHQALSDKRPHRRLLCFGQIAPILVHNFVNLMFQLFVFHYVKIQPWFLPYNIPQDKNVKREYNSFESYSVFCVSIFQYVWSALIFSRGAPFRSRFYKSRAFSAHLIALLIANHAITIYLPEPIRSVFQIFPPPSLFYRITMIVLAYMNLACSFICVRAVEELAQCGTFRRFKKLFTDEDHLDQVILAQEAEYREMQNTQTEFGSSQDTTEMEPIMV